LHAISEEHASLGFIAHQRADVQSLCQRLIDDFLARPSGCASNQDEALITTLVLGTRPGNARRHCQYRHYNP
jgi:hypothetical protein